MFYKCYNEDVMVFAQWVKKYKVSCKYVKSVGTEVLSLGFPASEVEKGNLTLANISKTIGAVSYKEETNGIVFSLKEDIKLNFEEFQAAIITTKESVAKKESSNDDTDIQKLVKMIQEFDVANHSPMQGMAFIQELKTHIKTLA
jgi:hypothetical protein